MNGVLLPGPFAQGAEEILDLASEASGGVRFKPLSTTQLLRDGLKPGTTAPSFRLPSVSGDTVSLEDYRGRRVLLVFSDPDCGPCNELAPLLARFEREYHDELAVLLVSRGDEETNRVHAAEHGIGFPVLLQQHWKLSREYGIFATPSAFLIGPDGRIEEKAAVGFDPILALAHSAVKKAPSQPTLCLLVAPLIRRKD